MNQWFRFYSEVVDDPKVQRLSLPLFRTWVNLLCLASANCGHLPAIDVIAYKLRVPLARAESQISELIAAGLFEQDGADVTPHNWQGRQFQSDRSTERVKRFRERDRNVSGNVSETHQIQNRTDTEQKPPISPPHPKTAKTLPPDTIEITDVMFIWLKQNGITANPHDETATMLDHFRGKGERRLDWIATWRTWMRNSKKFKVNGNGFQHKDKQQRNAETAQRLLSRMDSQDSGSGERGTRGSHASGIPRTITATLSRADENGGDPHDRGME